MMSLLIKSYLTILLSIGAGSLFIFMLGLYFILKNTGTKLAPANATQPLHPVLEKASKADLTDLKAIAGEDVIMTQLDLARAYIDADMKSLAKTILNSVVKQGSREQQEEAKRLLSL